MLKSDLSKYIRSRMGIECKCAFCNKPIFDHQQLCYTKNKLSGRSFYSFYHVVCWDELLELQQLDTEYQNYLERGYPDE